MQRKIRILIAKPGLDGHDRGAKVIARALRDAGMEVIYTGLRQTPEQIVAAAVQEDVDCIGLSILSGAHMTLFPRVLELMRAQGLEDVILFGGGIIPDEDVPKLKALGVAEIFTPGASTQAVIEYLRELCPVGRLTRSRSIESRTPSSSSRSTGRTDSTRSASRHSRRSMTCS
ncbi:MAG: cobalamin B12-binding domain-containing protein [Blastocatellia bacterium]|nr:cobalamin B12-binding domain-containing protein [Blastocatellia bacterium]